MGKYKHKYWVTVIAVALLALLAMVVAPACAMPAYEIGDLNHYTTITYQYVSSDAGWTNTFGYTLDGDTLMLGSNRDTTPGTIYDLGMLAPGDTIVVVDNATEPMCLYVVDSKAWIEHVYKYIYYSDEKCWKRLGGTTMSETDAYLYPTQQNWLTDKGFTEVNVTIGDVYKYKYYKIVTCWITGVNSTGVPNNFSFDKDDAIRFATHQNFGTFTEKTVSVAIYHKVTGHWESFAVNHTWTSDSDNTHGVTTGQTYNVGFEDVPLWRSDRDFNDMNISVTLTNATGRLNVTVQTDPSHFGCLRDETITVYAPDGTSRVFVIDAGANGYKASIPTLSLGEVYGNYRVTLFDGFEKQYMETCFVYEGMGQDINYYLSYHLLREWWLSSTIPEMYNYALIVDTENGHGYKAVMFGTQAGPRNWAGAEASMDVPAGTYTNAQPNTWLYKK